MSSNLREEIADYFARKSYTTLEKSRGLIGERVYYFDADSILSLIGQHFDELAKERGWIPPEEIKDIIQASNQSAIAEARKCYVKLDEDQSLPENPFEIDTSQPFALMGDSDEGKARRGGYYQAQQDMLAAHFRKVKVKEK